jgi:hypothetical protein
LVTKLWRYLDGKQKEWVTLNNTRIFLLAIQGFLIDHAPDVDRESMQKMEGIAVG